MATHRILDTWDDFLRFWLFLLYSEGFAVRREEAILGSAGHLAQDDEWRAWCATHRGMLAAELVRRVDAGESARDFFGSWHEV